MTQKHTPEPWKINHDDSTEEWSIVTNQHGSIVANVNEETGPEPAGAIPVMRKMPGMENARRIVACVNALAGVTTEELEAAAAIGIKDPRTGNLFSSRLKLERKIAEVSDQFNEMLDLLKSLENDAGQIPQFMWTKIQDAVKKHTGETK